MSLGFSASSKHPKLAPHPFIVGLRLKCPSATFLKFTCDKSVGQGTANFIVIIWWWGVQNANLFTDRECVNVDSPENGFISGHGRIFNDKVNYTCDEGFYLVGKPQRTCQADGSWSGSTPLCKRNSKYVTWSTDTIKLVPPPIPDLLDFGADEKLQLLSKSRFGNHKLEWGLILPGVSAL